MIQLGSTPLDDPMTACHPSLAARETPEGGASHRRARGGQPLRVTGGRLGGRRIRVPPAGVRPTADRVREALFARLGALEGCRALDLYAGSGALGIEALSRGAASAVFVEQSAGGIAVLRANLGSLALDAVARVERADVATALRRLGRAGQHFDLVLLDPPYAESQELERALRALVTSGILAPGAIVVAETTRRHPLPPIEGLEALDARRYGDTVIHWLTPRPVGDAPAPGGARER